ncbi:MAG: lysine-sensitive aspartokinase 3 [Acidobacteria bacterium]|nr:lysine-sensitive aspartokinase 3 [Acidobacteriota bacterium]MCW5970470.1 lysine-sensitive aspartokinase 3 [Blastocatellales bacterium]
MIVMKFGGTSVEDETAIRRLSYVVRRSLESDPERPPIVLVSAMAGATNTLLDCARLSCAGCRDAAESQLAALEARHDRVAAELVPAEELSELRTHIARLFADLRVALDEISALGRLAPHLSDAVASRGELLSSRIVDAALRSEGIRSVWCDIREAVMTDDDFTRAAVLFEQTDARLAAMFNPHIAAGSVPVTQGFLGAAPDGRTTTIGRGGSDYSAAIIGAALDADEIQIWTDVDGIMTTDPRIVAEASKVDVISYAEAAELAYFGAKVLHPSTLLPATRKGIPVSVRNSRRPEIAGTSIVQRAPQSVNPVRAIAFKRGITIVNISSGRMLMAYGFLARIFDVFARHQTAIDMVATSEVSVSMTLDDTRNLDRIIPELETLGEVTIERNRALICLAGEHLRSTPGVAARIFSSIDRINVSMISHGASAINVSFIVADEDLTAAVRALHTEFFSGEGRPRNTRKEDAEYTENSFALS